MFPRFSDDHSLKTFLDEWVDRVNVPGFIGLDPVQVPHRYAEKQDIEISGFFAAILAWGQRKTIIAKSMELMQLMDDTPYDFILNHTEQDLKRFRHFIHRTFQTTDAMYFIDFLKRHYTRYDSLEDAFLPGTEEAYDQESALRHFHLYFFDHPWAPDRTRKHIATPARKSTCKRLNMYLRWMVRSDNRGVDFGLWKRIPVARLMMPLDVHVENTARTLGLLKRKQRDWQAVEELTAALRTFDPADPVKYDYALFGIGLKNANRDL